MKRGWQRIAIVIGIIIVSVALDQATKEWARQTLQGLPPKGYLNNMFRLLFVHNEGAFLSGGANLSATLRYWLLNIFPAILLVGLFFYTLFSHSLNRWQIIGLAFIVAGGLSNVFDRFLYGKVVDFMNIGIGSLRSGIFNVADMSIMLGLFIMLPFAFQRKKEEEPTAKEEE